MVLGLMCSMSFAASAHEYKMKMQNQIDKTHNRNYIDSVYNYIAYSKAFDQLCRKFKISISKKKEVIDNLFTQLFLNLMEKNGSMPIEIYLPIIYENKQQKVNKEKEHKFLESLASAAKKMELSKEDVIKGVKEVRGCLDKIYGIIKDNLEKSGKSADSSKELKNITKLKDQLGKIDVDEVIKSRNLVNLSKRKLGKKN